MTLSTTAMRRLVALELLATDEPFLSIALPFRLASRANDHRSNHWGARAATSKAQRNGTHLALSAHKKHLRSMLAVSNLVVRVVRIAPTELDAHENLGMSAKAIVDGVADALAMDDRDHRATFVPDAEKSPTPKTWGVRVEFYEAGR